MINHTSTILIIDDDLTGCKTLEGMLRSVDYRIFFVTSGQDALHAAQQTLPDLVLLDDMMPEIDGFEVCRQLRAAPILAEVPIIMVMALDDRDSCIRGMESGADDFVIKPIDRMELRARVRTITRLNRYRQLLRRAAQLAHLITQPAAPTPTDQRSITVGRLRIDSGQHRAWLDDQLIDLSAREFTLLEYLTRRADTTVSPQELIRVTHSLETDDVEAGSLLRPMIRSLRRKLGYAVGEMGCIENVRGVGYRLVAPVHGQLSEAADRS